MTGVATPALPLLAAAAAELERNALVVSVHDVAPGTWSATREIIGRLAEHGVIVCSLLVVPDYHRTGPSMHDAAFVRELRRLEAQGHEVVIHGYCHERPRRDGESLRTRLLTRYYTAEEGEFYDLDYNEALRRIICARDDFRAAGLHPHGFIAPAWLLGPEAVRGARDAEMEYTTTLTMVRDLRRGNCFRARSIVYSARSRWRRTVSRGWNATLARLMADAPLVRLAIHPCDIAHPRVWRQIVSIVRALAGRRTPMTYCDWLAEQRIASAAEV